MKESIIYKKMVEKLSENKILLQRIESGSIALGIPDIFYRTLHQDGWIELKTIKNYPIRNDYIKIPWQPGQMNWIRNYYILNGNVFLFLHIENALWIFKGFEIKDKYNEREITQYTCYKAFWNKVDWNIIYDLLNEVNFS